MPDDINIAVPIEADDAELQRQRDLKKAKLGLEKANLEIEHEQPTAEKYLLRGAMALGEGAAGATKQAVGNVARTYADIVAPATPHPPGSLRSYLQWFLAPHDFVGQYLNLTKGDNNPEAPANVLRQAGKDLESEGTSQLQKSEEEGEALGGGYGPAIFESLARTAGVSAPALLAAPLGITPAAVAAGLQSYGNNITDFRDLLMSRDPSLSEDDAFNKAQGPAAITGAATAILTRTFGGLEKYIETITKHGLTEGGIKALTKEAFKSATMEFPEEYLDQLTQGVTEKAFINPDKPWKEIFDQAGLAGLAGFALGGITPTIIHGTAKAGEAVSEKVSNAIGQSRVRRQLAAESDAGLEQAISRRRIRNAEGTGEQVAPPSVQTPELVAQEESSLRLRNPPEDRVEAFPQAAPVTTGTVAAPAPVISAPAAPAAPAPPLLPGAQSIQEAISNYDALDTETLKGYQGQAGSGTTGFFWDLGSTAKTPEDVAALRQLGEMHPGRVRELLKTDMTRAMLEAGRQPAEAYEYATGVKLDGTPKWSTFENQNPSYVPPVPDPKYLAAHPPTHADKVETFLDSLKAPGDGTLQLFGIVPAAWNGLIEAVRIAYRSGKGISQAIDAGIQWLRQNHPDVKFNEPEVRQEIGKRYAATELPPVGGAQVAAGAAEVGRIVDQIYGQREAAGRELEGLAYERKQFKDARTGLKQLSDIATGRFLQQGLNPEEVPFPDPTDGVGIVEGTVFADPSFTDALSHVGVPYNASNVRAMQEEIFFEQSARSYNHMQARIQTLESALSYYQVLGVDAAEIGKVQMQLGQLQARAATLGEASHGGSTVQERAAEMTQAESMRQGRVAQRNALSLPPVAEFFGKQTGSYRDLSEKLKAALKLAEALVPTQTDQTALAAATAEFAEWGAVPSDVQSAIRNGQDLTTEQRASIFASLGLVFEDFDLAHARMNEMAAARIPEIDKEIRDLLKKVSTSKVQSGMGEVMLADVLSTLDGESGNTGTLQSQLVTQELRNRISAIETFAMNVGNNLETNKALFDWLSSPTTPHPFLPAAGAQYGVDPHTLQMILSEVKRNPNFGSAVVTLIEAADKKIAKMPATGLQQIEADLKLGTPEGQAAAEATASKMLARARSMTSLADASLKDSLKTIDGLEIERQTLQDGQAMFDEAEASDDFNATRSAVRNSPYGLVEPMVLQNNKATTFKPFGGDGIPTHPGLAIGASDSPLMKSDWFKKVAEWHRVAQEHVDAYDAATALHQADPVANQAPTSLGFDVATVRGLRDAADRFVPGSFLELSLNTENKRWKVPWLVRALSKLSWFRQHDFVAKMVGGVAGTDLRARLGDFINHFGMSQGIRDKYRYIPELLHAAMKSHPEVQMNMSTYRELWNEMAHWGRMFGSPVRPGFVLPRSGRTVTSEDFALLRKQRAYEDELRRRVTETNPTQGVRVRRGDRDLVRPGAYVGDEGMPRHLNREADTFIADVRDAYGQPAGGFDATTDLAQSSISPVVAFWNRHTDMLIQHVLDARRQDRDMRLTGPMQAAERDLAGDWIVGQRPSINSVGELVDAIVAHYPPTQGVNVRDQVVTALNGELRQYRDAAQRIATDREERDQARNSTVSIAFSADNEFTKPAANLELPSRLYDYGAISPSDQLLVASRANHERILAYATAIQRAIGDIHDRLQRYRLHQLTEQQAAGSYGGSIEEMKQVEELLRKISADFQAAYTNGNPLTGQSGWWREGFGLLTSAVLALPPVGIRNMTQGQFEVYAMSRAMGLAGHRLTMWNALLNMPKTMARFALHLGEGIVKRTNLGAALLTGQNRHIFEDMVGKIGEMLTGPDFRTSSQRVQELGMDGRDSFFRRMRRIWQETSEFTTEEEAQHALTAGGHKVGATAAIPVKTLRAIFDKLGVQNYDFAINATALTAAENLQRRMEEVAMAYGAERARNNLGEFDPTKPAWQLQPDEWAAFGNRAANADSLALFRLFLEGSASPQGFQLERSMWDYYKDRTTGVQRRLFSDPQFEAIQRQLLAEFNASTPANRQSASAGSAVIRNLLTLQGYVSDLFLKVINTSWGATRDRSEIGKILTKAPTIFLLAFMSTLIGYFAASMTGLWEKKVRGRLPSLPDPLDKDFWTSWKRWGEGTLRLSAVQVPIIGDFILALRGEIQGGRGFDPVGRVFPVSLAQRGMVALRGAWSTYKGAGTLSDALSPILDVARSMVPGWLEAENAFGKAQGAIKQSERVRRGEAQTQGLLEGKSGFQAPSYGPTTVVRRNIGDAISRWFDLQKSGDTAGAAAALATAKAEVQKLEDFHYRKYIAAGKDPMDARAKAQADTWNDYQDINPAVAAMLGKRPTAAQNDLILQGITGERRSVVDQGDAAWKAGAMALFGKEGQITREDIAANRSSGGPMNPALSRIRPPSATAGRSGILRRRSGSGGDTGITNRAPSVSSPVSRVLRSVRRRARGPASAVRRSVTRRRNPAAVAVRRAMSPKVSAGRQKTVGSRRRLSYAAA